MFLLCLLLFLMSSAAKIAVPFYFAFTISQIQLDKEIGAFLIGLYALLFFLIRGIEEFRFGFYVYFEQLFQKTFYQHLLKQLYRTPLSYLETESTSTHAINIERGVAGIRQFLYQAIFALMPLLLETIVLIYFLGLKVSVIIAIAVALMVIGLIIITYKFSDIINDLQKSWYETAGQNFALFSESLAAYQTVRSFGVNKWIAHRYNQALSFFIKQVMASIRPSVILGVIQALIIGGIVGLVTFAVLQKPLETEDKIIVLILANGLTIQIITPLIQFAGAYRELVQGVSASAILMDWLELPEVDLKVAHEFREDIQKITLENLVISYDDKPLLRIDSLDLSATGLTAIIGKTGAGKTSLGKALAQLKDYSGTIRVPHRLQPILYLSQIADIFDTSFEDNIMLGKKAPKLSKKMLLKAGFTQAEIQSLTGRRMGEGGSNLSGGQRNRLQIARGLYHGANCFVIDEPTSALDKQTAAYIKDCLHDMAKSAKLFVITHDPEFLSRCSEILVVEDGSAKVISPTSKTALRKYISKNS